MNAVCELLSWAKLLSRDTRVHFVTGLTWCSETDFVGPFELMLNTEHVKNMEYDGATVDEKSILERLKNYSHGKKFLTISECIQYLEHSQNP